MEQVSYQYSSPFGSFDWRTEFVSFIAEFAVESATEVMQEHKAVVEIEWKDSDGIMDEVHRYGLIEKVIDKIRKKYDDFGSPSF